MTASIGTYTLCNGTLTGGVAVSDLRINQTRTTDVVPILAGVSPESYDRECRPCNYTFTVKRTHASLEAAEAFILGLEVALPDSGTIKIITTDNTDDFSIPNGKFQSHNLIQHQGATTFHTYSIIGGPPAVSIPATEFILTETGSFILLETGGKIGLET